MRGEIHVDDVGTRFVVTVKDENDDIVDISGATVTFIFHRPDGTQLHKPATLVNDGTDGQVKYITESGDLNTHGNWRLQAFVDFGTREWYSDIIKFKVYNNIGC